ncbi:flavodoxin family protein [Nocardioides bigeumensis]|uniref:Flavodoxin-like domain-containing protein n=1 Tax=Nocardioides bigeumensis TaxID=433657 RepID=A0ABN2Y704_9ACTN
MTTTNRPQALVVYESMFGNTERVAQAVADGLRESGFEVDVHNVVWAPERLRLGYDLVVLGAPTHAFSLSRHSTRADAVKQGAPSERTRIGMRDWLLDLSWDGSPPAVAVFDTRATKVRHLRWAADRAMISLLRRRGLRPHGSPGVFLVTDVKGPLEPDEITRATTWARTLAETVPVAPGRSGS